MQILLNFPLHFSLKFLAETYIYKIHIFILSELFYFCMLANFKKKKISNVHNFRTTEMEFFLNQIL